MDYMLGSITIFAGTYAPQGWLFCEGQTLQIQQYTALYSLLGTTYGGDGRTTFCLPDLRGRAPIHTNSNPNIGLPTYPLGTKTGAVTTLPTPTPASMSGSVTLTAAQLPAHTHTATATVKIATGGTANDTLPAGNVLAEPTSNIYAASASGTDCLGGTSATVTVGSAGSGQPVPINLAGTVTLPASQQPVLALNYIICTEGIYPVRP